MKPYQLLLNTFFGLLGCYVGSFLAELFHEKFDAYNAFVTATSVAFVYLFLMIILFLFTWKK